MSHKDLNTLLYVVNAPVSDLWKLAVISRYIHWFYPCFVFLTSLQFIGLFVGLIFLQVQTGQTSVQNINGVLFFIVIQMSFGTIFPVIQVRAANLSIPWCAHLNKAVVVFPEWHNCLHRLFSSHYPLNLSVTASKLHLFRNFSPHLQGLGCCSFFQPPSHKHGWVLSSGSMPMYFTIHMVHVVLAVVLTVMHREVQAIVIMVAALCIFICDVLLFVLYQVFPEEKHIFLRDADNNMYKTWIYMVTKTIADVSANWKL